MNKRILKIWASVLMCIPLLAGCVDQNQGKTQTDTDASSRIVATSYATVCICDILNLDLVGIPTTSFELPERYKDKGITEVGSAMGPDTEIIASLNPTDILGPDTLIDTIKPTYDAMNMPSTFLNLRSVSGLYESISLLGEKYDRRDEANKATEEYNEKLKTIENIRQGKSQPKVLLLMGFPGSYCEATKSSYIGNLVEMAGGINVVTDENEDFVNVNTEELLSSDPDYILWTSHAMPDKVAEMFQKEFSENDVWKNFRAVKEGKVIGLDENLFSMSANFDWDEAVEFLCRTFYGE